MLCHLVTSIVPAEISAGEARGPSVKSCTTLLDLKDTPLPKPAVFATFHHFSLYHLPQKQYASHDEVEIITQQILMVHWDPLVEALGD